MNSKINANLIFFLTKLNCDFFLYFPSMNKIQCNKKKFWLWILKSKLFLHILLFIESTDPKI